MQELLLVYWPSIVGSACFTFASLVYVAEVIHVDQVNHSLCLLVPERLTLGYGVAMANLVGSVLFLEASLCYLVARKPWEQIEPWEFYVSEWGVRFTFAIGSFCFCVGALASLPEILN